MKVLRLRSRGLDLLAIVLAIPAILLFVISAPSAWEGGWLAVLSVAFAYIILFLAVHGIFVLWTVRGQGRGSFRRLLLWMIAISFALASLALVGVHLGYGDIFLDNGMDIGTVVGSIVALIALFILVFLTSILLVAVACSTMWFFSKAILGIVPRFLSAVRSVTYERTDQWYKRLVIWMVDFPSVLKPSSLRLEPGPLDDVSVKRRFLQAVFWQLVLGILLAIYISLNPLILQSISFSQTLVLVTMASLVVPLLVLPWSTLEVLGAKAEGVRTDFVLSKGARRRMIQTMVALGTLLLILRLAVEEIGIETIAWGFAEYIAGMFIISSLFSFVYFYFFEVRLIEGLRSRLGERGF